MSRDPTDDVVIPSTHGKPPPVEVGGTLLPCHRCQTLTQRATLAQYGARCYRCYEAYCQEPQPSPRFMGDKKLGDKDWAVALKAREESGERLTLAQKIMWREALGRPITSAIPSWEQTDDEFAHPLLATTAHGRVAAS